MHHPHPFADKLIVCQFLNGRWLPVATFAGIDWPLGRRYANFILGAEKFPVMVVLTDYQGRMETANPPSASAGSFTRMG